MDKLKVLVGYAEHLEIVAILHFVPAAVSWYFLFRPIGREEFFWVVFGFMVLTYYWIKRRTRKWFYSFFLQQTSAFKELPQIDYNTSEHFLDPFDIEILNTIDEQREEKYDYLKVIPALANTMAEEEIVHRLAKLRTIGMVKVQPSRLRLTPAGMEAITSPFISTKAIIPSKFTVFLTKARIFLDEGNFNGAMDAVNIFFEDNLTSAIEKKLGENFDFKWQEMLKAGIVNRPADKASLGLLLGACRHLGIIKPASLPDNILSIFLKLRVPEKHKTKTKTNPESDARSSLDLAQVFVRYWFSQ